VCQFHHDGAYLGTVTSNSGGEQEIGRVMPIAEANTEDPFDLATCYGAPRALVAPRLLTLTVAVPLVLGY
jgi:hypothetical protein